MSTIAAGTTTTTALVSTGNTDGTLQLQVNGTTPSVTLATTGAIGVGSTPGYGTSGQVLTSGGSSAAPTWAAPSSPSGSVIQVYNANASTTYASSANTNQQGPQTATFTLSSNSNKVLIIMNFQAYGYSNTTTLIQNYYSIFRGSVASGTQLPSMVIQDGVGTLVATFVSAANELYMPVTLTYLDTPGGSTTYSLAYAMHSGTNQTGARIFGYNITLMEIKA